MFAISNWLAIQLMNAAFRGIPFTPPSTVYLAMYTSNPTAADTGSEVAGGAYARQTIILTAPELENTQIYHPNTGQLVTVPLMTVKNNAEIVLPVASADWGAISHLGIRTAATGGNLLYFGPWKTSKTIENGDRARIAQGSIALRLG